MSRAELEHVYQLWQAASDRRDSIAQQTQIKAARLLTASAQADFWLWLADGLLDQRRKWFVAAFFKKYQVPKRLFKELLRAGVHEKDPSYNRDFIEPCVLSYGGERVCTELLYYLQCGTDVEKAGAANAYYWSRPRTATAETREKIRCQFLIEFVNNPDLQVRRNIIAKMELTDWSYPKPLRPLVRQAIAIARSHPDEYIRHRLAIHLRESRGPFMPLPTD